MSVSPEAGRSDDRFIDQPGDRSETPRFSHTTLLQGIGRRLEQWTNRPPMTLTGRAARALDERFNLRYLADRLQHEDRAIQEYLGGAASVGGHGRISIICRIYGLKFRYVREFIRSVQRQSYRDWQLCICVDGDSNARVRRLVRGLHHRDPERYPLLEHDRNQGICAATISALSLARGDVVLFADPDDTLHRYALAAAAHAFSSDSHVDIVYTNSDILTPWSYRIDPVYKPAWSPELLLGCNYIMHLVAVRRELIERCEGLWDPEVAGAEDWDMLLRVTRLAKRIHHIPIVLYHWRAHENSTATNAKPWTFATKNVLQGTYLSKLDPRLRWDTDEDAGPSSLRFRDGQAPPLYVIEVQESDAGIQNETAAAYPYPGEVRVRQVRVAGDLDQIAARLDSVVEALPDGDAMILLRCVDLEDSTLRGPIDALAAFGVLPGVACVWPFFDQWRGIYTVCEDFLSSRLRQSGFFTNWSGNVLTGPLHGLMLKREVWEKLGGFQACCKDEVPRPQPIQALGALLGLRALRYKMRNVAVRTVVSEWRPPVLELGPLVPECDPYV